MTIANQTPDRPKISGKTKIIIAWKTRALKNAKIAEMRPSPNAVKNPDDHILNHITINEIA